MITVSVPGKVHLMGEHAVVYGKPALLTAINLRLWVSVEPASSLTIVSREPADYVGYIVGFLTKEYKLTAAPKVKITIDSAIPAGFHLGSSAAVAVGTIGALTYFLKKIWNPQAFNQLAYEVEKKQHGNPSGGDNTAVTMGGFLWYRRELEFLKSMWQLPMALSKSLDHFFLINTGKPKETTGEMVALVNKKLKAKSTKVKMEKLFDENERQTRRIATAIKEANEKELIDAIKEGERTLEGMGVVSKKAVSLIREIENGGGAAKILGGGGADDSVGFLLCYHAQPKQIEGLIPIKLGQSGIELVKK